MGVGKSRLAREALVEAERDGWSTYEVRASSGLAGVPLGPLRRDIASSDGSGDAPRDVEELAALIERELLSKRSARGLALFVDDAHDLDASSAGLIHQLVSTGAILAVCTTRATDRPPQSITDLWKDGFADRIEVQPLSRRQTVDLVQHVLGGPLEESGTDRLWQLTEGNPLYVREVLLACLQSGALRKAESEWRWRGEWAAGGRLREIVASRLSGLDADELGVLELLAVGGPLPLNLVEELATARALATLEERSVIRIEHAGRRLEVTAMHPVHVEVTRGQMTALQQRAVRRALLEALSRTPNRRSDDRLKQAWWSLELGVDVDPVALSLGADVLVYKIGHDFAGRLDEILGETHAGVQRQATPEASDPRLAIRLARAAYERTGRMAEGVLLARALSWTGATDEAEAVLSELVVLALVDQDRVQLELARAWILFWGRYDVDRASAVLHDAIENAGDCPADVVADAYQQLAGIWFNTGHPREALVYAERAAALVDEDVSTTIAAPVTVASLACLGSCQQALELVDRALTSAGSGAGHPLTLPTLLFSRVSALLRTGRFEEARTLAETCRDVAIATDSLDGAALFGVILGEIMLQQGLPASAGRILRDAAGLFSERDVYGYRPWALTALARARLATGDAENAAAYLEQARTLQPIARYFDTSRYRAEIELCAFGFGKGHADAVRAAEAGLAWAREGNLVIDEAFILDALFRIDRSPTTAARLAKVAASTDSDIVAALAEHATALVNNDAEGLLRVGERFTEMKAWWFAAEATAAAALAHIEQGRTRSGQSAAHAAVELSHMCEGARTVFVAALSAPATLTRRESEVARLAATGLSNRQIAERLYLSSRTVETHLQRAYIKLGVNDRAGLAVTLGVKSG